MNWVHIATAPGQIEAEMWRDILVDAGVPALVGQGDFTTFLGVSASPVRVLVDKKNMEKAFEVLRSLKDRN